MSSSKMPIPILLTGRGEPVGRLVADKSGPEFEVIHFTLAAAAHEELPFLLQGKIPAKRSSSIGSGNWDEPPRALILGGAYTDSDVNDLRQLIEKTPGARRIPWVRIDSSKPAPQPMGGHEYGLAVLERMKEGLKKLEEDGKLNGEDQGIYFV